jgi:MFS family permease
MGESAMRAGLALTAMSFAWPTGGFIAGQALTRISYRQSSSLGSIVLVFGAIMMAFLSPSLGAYWAIASAFFLGLGMGLTNMGFFVGIQASVDWHQRGLVTASFNYSRIIGQSVGTAIFGGIVNAALVSHMAVGGDSGDLASRILDPALRAGMNPDELAPLLDAFAGALRHIYEIDVLLAVACMAWALGLPQGLGVHNHIKK